MKYLYLCTLLILFSSSCTTSPVTPTHKSRQAIDSIFQHQTLFMQSQMDSMCANVRKQYYQVTIDSIMHARQSEMEKLIR